MQIIISYLTFERVSNDRRNSWSHGKTVQTPWVTVLLNEKLAAVFQAAATTNPTPFENRLNVKDEVHKNNPHTHNW